MGNTLSIHQLCTNEEDISNCLEVFFDRLMDRGHQQATLLPIFIKAIENAETYLLRTADEVVLKTAAKKEALERRAYLHLPYHPDNPPSRFVQKIWRRYVAEPQGEKPINKMKNYRGAEIPLDQLIIAYHQAPNLGNLLSYRKIEKRTGSKVSSFCKD